MGRIQIDTDMLICALEDHNFEVHYYLDIKTGEIVTLTDLDIPEEDELRESLDKDKDRYIYIEPIDSRESYAIMERFVYQLPEGKSKNNLTEALKQRKPFRQFKDTLHDYPDIREKWFQYHNQEIKKIAREWLQYNNIDAELLPLPEKRIQKEKKKREHILSKKQIKYLSYGFDLMYDEMKNDIETLSRNKKETDNTWLWDVLPPIGRAELNINMAFKLLTSLITLVYKFHIEEDFMLGNRAEELLLHIAIENALRIAEGDQVEIRDFNTFIDCYFEDTDFLMMYDQEYDGIDESPIGEMMRIGSLSPKDWFTPYNMPRQQHPFFWPDKERLKFPANKEITDDLDI